MKSDELRQRVSQISPFYQTTKRVYETRKKNRRSRARKYILTRSRILGNRRKQKKLACHINRMFAFDREQKHGDRVSKETPEFQVEGYVRNTSENNGTIVIFELCRLPDLTS